MGRPKKTENAQSTSSIKIPVCEKVTLSMEEASEYSNIGMNKLYEITNAPMCPFVLYIGSRKRLIKRRKFEKYLESRGSI